MLYQSKLDNPMRKKSTAKFETKLLDKTKNHTIFVGDSLEILDEIKDNVDDVISDFPEWVGYVECIKIPNVVDLFFGKQLTIDMHRLNLHEDVEPGYIEKTSAEDSAAQREFFRNRAG